MAAGLIIAAIAGAEGGQFMNGLIYVDGAFRPAAEAAVNVLDHGLLYGDGIFEGIRAYNGRVFRLERHIERLFDSAKAIRLDIPLSPTDVAQAVLETCRQNDIQDGYIRLVVTRGIGDLSVSPVSCRTPTLVIIAREVAPLFLVQVTPHRHGAQLNRDGDDLFRPAVPLDPAG